MSPPQEQPHSAEYFGDQRDFWWNRDFVELMAKRWQLAQAHHVLDVGAGVGHWSRVLAPFLPATGTLIGLEREPKWVAEAQKRANDRGLGHRFTYQQGDAMKLPFAANTFDLVTCQTVLIHLPDVKAAVREMLRVLKPGGLLAVAEPNNIGCALVLGSTRFDDDVDSILRMARFQIVCERGKAALGEGHNSIGELLPGVFNEAGLGELQVYMGDHVSTLVPPYASREQSVNVRQALEWAERDDFINWSRVDTERYFFAGKGGSAEDFEALWAEALRLTRRTAEGLRAKTEHLAGGSFIYLVSGRKPRES